MSRCRTLEVNLSEAEAQLVHERAVALDMTLASFLRLRVLGVGRLLCKAAYRVNSREVSQFLRQQEDEKSYECLLEEHAPPQQREAISEFDILTLGEVPVSAEFGALFSSSIQGYFVVAGSPCPFRVLRARLRVLPNGQEVPSVLLQPDWGWVDPHIPP
jgi:hypothetical protein